MADYIYLPKVTDVFTEGEIVFSYPNTGDTKAGYVSNIANSIKLGCYRGSSGTVFVFAANHLISDAGISFVSPYGVTLFTVDSISIPFEGGYYAEKAFSVATGVATMNITVYNSLGALLEAFGNVVPPSPTSGVVVTAIASPIETPPAMEGVIVYAVARLLDPNTQGGTSVPGGGQGTFDETSDPIPIPALPSISAAQSGLVGLFKPTIADLRALGSYLWTNLLDFIENLNKLFMNPMDYLIALNIFPCNPETGERREIKIGSITTSIDMPPVLNQWYELNCGDIIVPEYWGSALDYAPNTKIHLFLPFIGSVTLNTDEVMGNKVGVVYRIDLLSGQCVAMVTISGLVDQTASVLYQFTGECAVSVPLTGADWSRIYSAVIGAAGSAITGFVAAGAAGVAAGGATAALAGANAAEAASNAGLAYAMINDTSKGVRGVQAMREDMQRAAQMALSAGEQAAAQPGRVAKGVRATRIASTVNNVAGNIMSGKAGVNHTGTITGNAGMLGVKTPYVLIEYPNQSLAENYKHFVGYPSNMYAKLGELSGYTEVEQVIADGLVNQTDSEMAELLETLKGGVYL